MFVHADLALVDYLKQHEDWILTDDHHIYEGLIQTVLSTTKNSKLE